MRTILLVAFVQLTALSTQAQNTGINGPSVDEREELVSIASRIAGYQEYNMDFNKAYVKDIHDYFDKDSTHPLIAYMKVIRDSNSIGFDALANMAVHLSDPPALEPLVAFNDSIPDKRYGKAVALTFDSLLRQFYTDTHFHDFFLAHKPMYDLAKGRFMALFQKLDRSWYHDFYGIDPKGTFNIVIGLGNGGGNYGPKVIFPDGDEQRYAIIGAWKFDSAAAPLFSEDEYLPTLIHEFNHSYVNWLTAENIEQLSKSGDSIYPVVAGRMQRQAYGEWKTMMSEALVRAAVIRYMIDHQVDSTKIAKERLEQLNRGFLWIDGLVSLLGNYETERSTYPTLRSYMPQIITFYKTTASHIHEMDDNYAMHKPHVRSIEPFANKDTTVDPTITQIKVHFDKPLFGKGYSINYGEGGNDHWPNIKDIRYADNNQSVILQVSLKPGWDYDFILTGNSFRSVDGYPLEPYEVKFKTRY
jgi:hypothetical protein